MTEVLQILRRFHGGLHWGAAGLLPGRASGLRPARKGIGRPEICQHRPTMALQQALLFWLFKGGFKVS